MCRTLNAPHARACTACGVSLAIEDQEAVRARVTAPRAGHLAAPQLAPPVPAPYLPPPQQGFGHALGQGMHGQPSPPLMHAPQPRQTYPSVNWQAPPSAQPPGGPSAWQRFLTWTGLR